MKEKLFVIFLVLLHYQYFDINSLRRQNYRLQNSAYFCLFKYGRAVKQKVWNEAENSERDWGETLKMRIGFFSLARFANFVDKKKFTLIIENKYIKIQVKNSYLKIEIKI